MSEQNGNLIKEIAALKPEKLNPEEKELLELYRSADDGKKKEALLGLKNKKTKKKLLSLFSSAAQGDDKNGNSVSSPLLGFTFFYSVSIYILLLSFYFWQWRTDIKPEKKQK